MQKKRLLFGKECCGQPPPFGSLFQSHVFASVTASQVSDSPVFSRKSFIVPALIAACAAGTALPPSAPAWFLLLHCSGIKHRASVIPVIRFQYLNCDLNDSISKSSYFSRDGGLCEIAILNRILYGYTIQILVLNRIGASCQEPGKVFLIWEKESATVFPHEK